MKKLKEVRERVVRKVRDFILYGKLLRCMLIELPRSGEYLPETEKILQEVKKRIKEIDG